MAPRSRPAVDPEQTKLLEAAAQEIGKVALGHLVEVDGTPTCTVKKNDGTYSNSAVTTGTEFAFSSVYVGKRGVAIFVFEPVDAQAYAFLEVDAKKIDTVFPTFTPEIAAKLGQDTESMEALLGHFLGKAQLVATAAKQAAEDELKAGAENHPNFGMFA